MNLSTLTIEQARSVEAGAETDALVAEVCGFGARIFDFAFVGDRVIPASDMRIPGNENAAMFSPSTDANAAIEAAEADGLLCSCYCVRSVISTGRLDGDNAWECSSFEDELLCRAPTFALAICRAILVRYVLGREAKA
jgi:hypothetical protein